MSGAKDCKKPFHKHLMLRGLSHTPPRDTQDAIAWLHGFVRFLGMKILQGPFSTYVDAPGNRGITATVMIETSHIAFHVWDEQEPSLVQLDVYTCGSLNVQLCLERIASFFGLSEYEFLVYDREKNFQLIDSGVVNRLK